MQTCFPEPAHIYLEVAWIFNEEEALACEFAREVRLDSSEVSHSGGRFAEML